MKRTGYNSGEAAHHGQIKKCQTILLWLADVARNHRRQAPDTKSARKLIPELDMFMDQWDRGRSHFFDYPPQSFQFPPEILKDAQSAIVKMIQALQDCAKTEGAECSLCRLDKGPSGDDWYWASRDTCKYGTSV